MKKFDFKKYHVRAMNAASEKEKVEINQELKDFYEDLNETEKAAFNRQLEDFLINEYKKINTLYNGVKN